jgi:penicillin amidase
MRHPLSASLPGFVARWLDAPFEALPGDREMARVQTPTSGASERLVVSPGREQYGVFHMPGGQSGHPLSPYYLAGHDDWVRGIATPLLPGVSKYQLALLP